MGAEREDTEPGPNKAGTEPGIGPRAPGAGIAPAPGGRWPMNGGTPPGGIEPQPASGPHALGPARPAAESIPIEAVDPATSGETPALGSAAHPAPAPGDFDALHAALGEGSRHAAPKPTSSQPKAAKPVAPKPKMPVAESQGRSSATYASARPHSLKAPHVAAELSQPAVIVSQDDTSPGGPPRMTAPLGAMPTPMPPPLGHSPSVPPSGPASGPHHVGPISSPPMEAGRISSPGTPQAFAVPGLPNHPGAAPHLTMRMPERPRRPRTPTVVVRPRGPSTKQKIAVFALMLVLVITCGVGVVMWRAPHLFGIGASAQHTAPRVVAPPTAPTTTATLTPFPTMTATLAPAPTLGGASATSPTAMPTHKAAKPPRPH